MMRRPAGLRVQLLLGVVLLGISASAQTRPALNTISKVQVNGGNIEIIGSKKPSFTTFSMQDPPRLVIDISEAVFSGVPEQLEVGNGTVTAIKTASYGSEASAIARVLIGFGREMEPALEAVGNTLVVKLGAGASPVSSPPVAAKTSAAPVPKSLPTAPSVGEVASVEAPPDSPVVKASKAAVATPAQTRASEAQRAKEASEAKQAAAATLAQTQATAAQKAKEASEAKRAAAATVAQNQADAAQKAKQASEAKQAAAATLAQTQADAAKKNEEALEAKQKAAAALAQTKADALEARRAAAAQKRTEALEAKAKVAEERKAAALARRAPESKGKPRTLMLVGFTRTATSQRISVRTDQPAEFQANAQGDGAVVLEMENTRFGHANDQRRLDTSFFPGPVASINPKQGPGRSVQLEIRLKQKATFTTHQEGNEVSVEFPLTAAP